MIRGLNKASGQTLWQYDASRDGGRPEFHGPALVLKGGLFISSDDRSPAGVGHLYALDPRTGSLHWKKRIGRGIPTSLLSLPDSLCGVTLEDQATCLAPATGVVIWEASPSALSAMKAEPPSHIIPTGLARIGGLLIHGTRDGVVRGLDERSGKERWATSLGSRVTLEPVLIPGGDVLVGTLDRRLHRLRPADGSVQHTFAVGGIPIRQPIVRGTTVVLFVATNAEAAELQAFDLADGRLLWSRTSGSGVGWASAHPVADENVAWVGSDSGEVAAVLTGDGSVAETFQTGGRVAGIGLSLDFLFVGSTSGRIQAIRRRVSR